MPWGICRTAVALFLALAPWAGFADAAPPSPPVPEITGRVTDIQGKPIAGAQVWAVPEQRASAWVWKAAVEAGPQLSAEDGSFMLRGLPAGKPVNLEICAGGFEPQNLFLPRPGPEPVRAVLSVVPPPPPPHAARISGRVVDARGRPVAGTRVLVETGVAFERADGSPVRSPCRPDPLDTGVRSDSEGRFTLGPLQPRRDYQITAVAEGYLTAYARGLDLAPDRDVSGVVLTLKPEAVVTSGISGITGTGDKPAAAVRVRGSVVDGEGQPVVGARVWAARTEVPATTSAEDGSFELSLTDGSYEILAQRQGYGDTRPSWVKVNGHPLPEVTLRMVPGATVTGRVLGFEPEDGEVTVEANGQYAGPAVGEHRTVAEPDGRYRLPDLAPGNWGITARAGDRYVSAEVELKPGQKEAVRDLPLWPRFTARGRVLGPDGSPIQGAQVQRFPNWGGEAPTTTGADGTFAFRIAPGTYDFVARYGSFGLGHAEAPLPVPGGPPEGATLRLGPPAVLEGRLLGLQPGDLSSAVLHVHKLIGSWQPYIERDDKGRYRIVELGGGEWQLFSGSQGREEIRTVRLEPGGKGTLDIDYSLGTLGLSVCFVQRSGGGRGWPVVLRRAESPEGPDVAFDETDMSSCVRYSRLKPGRYVLVEGIHSPSTPGRIILEVDLQSSLKLRFNTDTWTLE